MRINIKFRLFERIMAVARSETQPTECYLSLNFAPTR